MDKINEIVKREISLSIFELFPGEIVSVTAVDVSRDLSYAKIWISALNKTQEMVEKCQAKAKEMTQNLSQKLITRRVPRLHFVADQTAEQANKIDKLLDEIHQENN